MFYDLIHGDRYTPLSIAARTVSGISIQVLLSPQKTLPLSHHVRSATVGYYKQFALSKRSRQDITLSIMNNIYAQR